MVDRVATLSVDLKDLYELADDLTPENVGTVVNEALPKVGTQGLADFTKVTSSWTHKPNFQMKLLPKDLAFEILTDSSIFIAVDRGVPEHLVRSSKFGQKVARLMSSEVRVSELKSYKVRVTKTHTVISVTGRGGTRYKVLEGTQRVPRLRFKLGYVPKTIPGSLAPVPAGGTSTGGFVTPVEARVSIKPRRFSETIGEKLFQILPTEVLRVVGALFVKGSGE